MPEEIFYDRNRVLVTKSRIVIGDSTYPTNALSAVKHKSETKHIVTRDSKIFFTIGIFIFILPFVMDMSPSLIPINFVFSLVLVYFGNQSKKVELLHNIVIHTSGINTQIYSSKNKTEIEEIIKAINEAIIARG